MQFNIGGSKHVRYFKTISVNNKTYQDGSGRYTSKTSPRSAAKKAFTQLSKQYKTNKLTICIKETTQGSSKKEYGPYVCEKVKLEKPLKIMFNDTLVTIKYKTKIHLVTKKSKQKGGMPKTGLYGYLRTKELPKNGDDYKKIANLINNDTITTRNQINKRVSPPPVNQPNSAPPEFNNMDENHEKGLLSTLNFKSLMSFRLTSKARKNMVNKILRKEDTLKQVFNKTTTNDPDYIKRLYEKSLKTGIPFLPNANKERFTRLMKEVIVEKGITGYTGEPMDKWLEWCSGRYFEELSHVLGQHTFTLNNFEVGNTYYYEGGRVVQTGDLTISQITYYNNDHSFLIRIYFGNSTDIIQLQYCLPQNEDVMEDEKSIGWNIDHTIAGGYLHTFRPN